MKKILFIVFVSTFALCSRAAYSQPAMELKAGYFFFYDQKMGKIYDRAGQDLQLNVLFPIRKKLELCPGVGYLEKWGKSLNAAQKTTMRQIFASLGLQFTFPVSSVMDYYLSLGPRYFFVYVKNDSSFVSRKIHENGLGGFAATGFLLHLSSHFYLNLFGECSYKKMHFHSSKENVIGHTVQVGGLAFGGGMGYRF